MTGTTPAIRKRRSQRTELGRARRRLEPGVSCNSFPPTRRPSAGSRSNPARGGARGGLRIRRLPASGGRPGRPANGTRAAPALIELARARVPEADLHVGDMQFLPFEEDSFDVVAGQLLLLRRRHGRALREAGRVAKPGAPVPIQVWGRPEHCDLTAMLRAVGPLRPARPPGTPTAPPSPTRACSSRSRPPPASRRRPPST